ncbi:MAG: hypothetical protein ABFS37_03280 [Acidobacteriota bacterium]
MYTCKDFLRIKRHVLEGCSHRLRAVPIRFHVLGRPKEIRPFFVVGLMLALVSITSIPLGADEGISILTDRDAASVFVVDVEGRCSELHLGVPEAMLTWRIDVVEAEKSAYLADLAASDAFRVDLSKFPEGLKRGDFDSLTISRTEAVGVFDSARPFKKEGPESLAIVIPRLEPGVYYRTRVLALTPDGWIASPEVHFMSPICAVDGLDEIEGGER